MKVLGFYQELWPKSAGSPDGSIRDFVCETPEFDESDIARYLGTAHEILVFMGSVKDVLGSDKRVLGGDNILTDGEWVWRADLEFYLRNYHVALPAEFLAKVRESRYTVPAVERDQLLRINEEVVCALK
ncbi:hypothetical protein SXANM310S_00323 [Streptomyces xanthochromogenes]